MREYNPPNPYSIMDTKKMERTIKEDKEEFKKNELESELKNEKIKEFNNCNNNS